MTVDKKIGLSCATWFLLTIFLIKDRDQSNAAALFGIGAAMLAMHHLSNEPFWTNKAIVFLSYLICGFSALQGFGVLHH